MHSYCLSGFCLNVWSCNLTQFSVQEALACRNEICRGEVLFMTHFHRGRGWRCYVLKLITASPAAAFWQQEVQVQVVLGPKLTSICGYFIFLFELCCSDWTWRCRCATACLHLEVCCGIECCSGKHETKLHRNSICDSTVHILIIKNDVLLIICNINNEPRSFSTFFLFWLWSCLYFPAIGMTFCYSFYWTGECKS